MIAWTNKYINWLETNKLGIDECASPKYMPCPRFRCRLLNPRDSNHGSFCFNQLLALKLLVNDVSGSVDAGNKFFNGIFQGQINSTGDQVSSIASWPLSNTY